MIVTVKNEVPFQILSSSFSIGPSETGYDLQVGADSRNFTTLFSVGANTPRMVTNVANGSYFRLKNNVGDVKVNWQRVCTDDGGGSSVDLSAYWTSAETQSAITAVEDHLFDVEEVTASALTELHEGLLEVSGRTVDLSNYATSGDMQSAFTLISETQQVAAAGLNQLEGRIDELSGSSVDMSDYWTSAETQDAISAATSGKADAANIQAHTGGIKFPLWNSQGIITGPALSSYWFASDFKLNGSGNEQVIGRGTFSPFYAPVSAGTAGDILVSTGNGAPVWTTDNKVSSTYISNIWKGTQSDYDDIPTKDPDTFYIIVNN